MGDKTLSERVYLLEEHIDRLQRRVMALELELKAGSAVPVAGKRSGRQVRVDGKWKTVYEPEVIGGLSNAVDRQEFQEA